MQVVHIAIFVVICYVCEQTIARSVPQLHASCPYTRPVHTNYGTLRGITTDRALVFYGIPYAMPPVGQRRWKAPETPMALGDQTFLSITQPPGCPQVCGDPEGTCPTYFSEDCLYLNIFTPLTTTEYDRLPVMIFLHGGNFDHGGAATILYDGQQLANSTNTIMVVINYRVGALGFLVADGDTEDLNGNFGILDQRFAFKYVQENIAAFGGDPDMVTLFGHSAGAQSIAIHMIANGSANYFHRAIMQSNPFTLPYHTRHAALELEIKLAERLDCDSSDIDCLRSCTSDEVFAAQQAVVSASVIITDLLQNIQTFAPSIDSVEMTIHPLLAFNQGLFHDKPMILGTLSEDALPYVYDTLTSPVSYTEANAVLLTLFGVDAFEITQLYPLSLLGDQRDVLSDISTDVVFACSTRNASIAAYKHGHTPVYVYEFSHGFSFEEAWGSDKSYCYGVACHGSELPFVFQNAEAEDYMYTTEELSLSNSMIYYWSNFAHTGNPNLVGEKSTANINTDFTTWPIFKYDNGWAMINLDVPLNQPLSYYNVDECNLFDSIGYDKTYSLEL